MHRTGKWAVLMDDQPPPAPNWFVLDFGSNPWRTDAEVLADDWQEAVVLTPGPGDGIRLAAALAAAHGVDGIDVSEPEVLADALRRLAEEVGRG